MLLVMLREKKLNIASHFMDTISDWTQRHEYNFLMNFNLLIKSLAVQIGFNSKKMCLLKINN